MFELLAQTEPVVNSPNFIQSITPYVPLILVVLIMYFFVFNAKRKDEKSRKSMIEQLKKGDRVQTIGGVLGTIVTADNDEIVVKVDESTNTKIRFTRTAVHRVLTESSKADANLK